MIKLIVDIVKKYKIIYLKNIIKKLNKYFKNKKENKTCKAEASIF